jgi:DNA repair exonuclease SbcCD ATPase subunit
MNNTMKHIAKIMIILGALLAITPVFSKNHLDKAMDVEIESQSAAQVSQQKVEQLDDQSRQMLEEYRQLTQQLARTKRSNDELQVKVTQQTAEIAHIQNELEEIERLRHDLDPLMQKMLQTLGELIDLDTPFLEQERQARVTALEQAFADRKGTISERFRQVLEAYQIEADYGRHIEAYQGEIKQQDGIGKIVDFLRLGRVALFYQTLDGQEGGIWDNQRRVWRPLNTQDMAGIKKALRIAKKQLPPDLMELPLWLSVESHL